MFWREFLEGFATQDHLLPNHSNNRKTCISQNVGIPIRQLQGSSKIQYIPGILAADVDGVVMVVDAVADAQVLDHEGTWGDRWAQRTPAGSSEGTSCAAPRHPRFQWTPAEPRCEVRCDRRKDGLAGTALVVVVVDADGGGRGWGAGG